MTLVCDLDASAVEYIGEGRAEASMAAYFETLSQEQREAIEAISRDMWPATLGACCNRVPGAERNMVVDRFHSMRRVLEAVDKVRKQEHGTLLGAGDDRLSRSKYLWLTNPGNMTGQARAQFADLKTAQLNTASLGDQGIPARVVGLPR